jgi:histidinol-phosphatase (PHP family)
MIQMEPKIKNYKQNLHSHSTYCGGVDTPEEMINIAIQKGFHSIGFSEHTYMYYAPGWGMELEKTEDYKKEIKALREKYKGKIDIFMGLEVDMFSEIDLSGYDYLIGSTHYLQIGEEKVGFDRTAEEVERIIKEYFGGDGMAFAKEYYRTLAQLPNYGKFDIIGHFDQITKNCEKRTFFDEDSKEYRFAAIEAAEALAGKIPYFEVNTGAIARGLRTTPYPSPFVMKELKRLGFGAVITSDCHDAALLDCGYELAAELLKECGYKEHYVLTKEGFAPQPL